MNISILHLNLKRKWFDMILSGEKKEEYRDIKPFYERIFLQLQSGLWIRIHHVIYIPGSITICFSNGYAKDRPQFLIECKGLRTGIGKKEWGASGKLQFILSLGDRIT